MRTSYFFKCCTELVKSRPEFSHERLNPGYPLSRWRSVIEPEGNIYLFRTDDEILELPRERWHPLCAVANEVTGFRPNGYGSEFSAAEKLALPKGAALLLFVAAIREAEPHSDLEEVRQELVCRLSPLHFFEPPLNKLPWRCAL